MKAREDIKTPRDHTEYVEICRTITMKAREDINTSRDHIEYVEICRTITMKARQHIRKHNLDEIREISEAYKSVERSEEHTA